VLTPILIAGLMIFWGTLASQCGRQPSSSRSNWGVWLLNLIGVALALYVFMEDSIRASGGGVDALRNLLPTRFNWPLFLAAWALMAAPAVKLTCQLWVARARRPDEGALVGNQAFEPGEGELRLPQQTE
jgi:hypothetical protein